jgi:hypothetical protein
MMYGRVYALLRADPDAAGTTRERRHVKMHSKSIDFASTDFFGAIRGQKG